MKWVDVKIERNYQNFIYSFQTFLTHLSLHPLDNGNLEFHQIFFSQFWICRCFCCLNYMVWGYWECVSWWKINFVNFNLNCIVQKNVGSLLKVDSIHINSFHSIFKLIIFSSNNWQGMDFASRRFQEANEIKRKRPTLCFGSKRFQNYWSYFTQKF